MKYPFLLGNSNASRWSPFVVAAILITGIAGCASPGTPHAPSLNLPEPVKDLTANRIGDEVHLHWTTPEKTTDRIAIKGSITAQLCRVATALSSTCTPINKIPTQTGPSQTVDTLPPSLTADPPALLIYRVEILNASGHSAGPSTEAFVASGIAPPSIAAFRATPTRDGAMLEWQPQATSAAVELDRLPVDANGVVIEPTPKPASKSKTKPNSKAHSDHPAKSSPQKPLLSSTPRPTEIKLRTPAQPTDSGGTIDHTAQMGETYHYTAQRVRTLSLNGHALEIRSAISPPATVVMRNTFPPQAPTGLEAIPGTTTQAAASPSQTIDLSWTPNSDPGLAGYNVYRQNIDSNGVVAGTAARLNQTPVVGPAFRDQTAVAGRRYAYRVTAVDTAGNESAPSADVQETAREQ